MKWISVKEQLPNKYERVLVTDGEFICFHSKQSACNFEGSEGDDLYTVVCCSTCYDITTNCCGIDEGKITHWMYLPKIEQANV